MGWKYESNRHSLAARGVRTSTRRYHAKTFAERLFDAQTERRKRLVGLGTKQQEVAGTMLRERATVELTPYERSQAKLQVLDVQRSGYDRDWETLEEAYPLLSAREVVLLKDEAKRATDGQDPSTPARIKELHLDALERKRVLDKYQGLIGSARYAKLSNALREVIDMTKGEQKTWEEL